MIRDRGALAREAAPGVIENVYRLQIMNTDEKPRAVHDRGRRACPGLKVVGVEQPVAVGARRDAPVAAPAAGARPDAGERRASHAIEIAVAVRPTSRHVVRRREVDVHAAAR